MINCRWRKAKTFVICCRFAATALSGKRAEQNPATVLNHRETFIVSIFSFYFSSMSHNGDYLPDRFQAGICNRFEQMAGIGRCFNIGVSLRTLEF